MRMTNEQGMPEEQEPSKEKTPTPAYVAWRKVIAIAAGVALVVILIQTSSAASEETAHAEASAVRLAEIYVEGAFFSLTAIGGAFCGYIFTRWER